MVVKSKVLTDRVLVEILLFVFSFRAKIVYFIVLVMFLSEESLDMKNAVSVPSFGAF